MDKKEFVAYLRLQGFKLAFDSNGNISKITMPATKQGYMILVLHYSDIEKLTLTDWQSGEE